MATTLMELYPDNRSVKIGALLYASMVGIGVSTNIHWFSDAVTGALMGYSIGKSVGRSFKGEMDKTDNLVSFSFALNPTIGTLIIRF